MACFEKVRALQPKLHWHWTSSPIFKHERVCVGSRQQSISSQKRCKREIIVPLKTYSGIFLVGFSSLKVSCHGRRNGSGRLKENREEDFTTGLYKYKQRHYFDFFLSKRAERVRQFVQSYCQGVILLIIIGNASRDVVFFVVYIFFFFKLVWHRIKIWHEFRTMKVLPFDLNVYSSI